MSESHLVPPVSRTFGHIPGYDVGHKFDTRADLVNAGVHGHMRAGIHGDPIEGAYSICMAGGYEDNRDDGEKIVYVGSGGRDVDTKIAHQTWGDHGNLSLQVSCATKRPVRVIRGSEEPGPYAPRSGYRYDGLYVVDSATMELGNAGFNMCRFRLRRIREEGDSEVPHRRRLTSKILHKKLKSASRS